MNSRKIRPREVDFGLHSSRLPRDAEDILPPRSEERGCATSQTHRYGDRAAQKKRPTVGGRFYLRKMRIQKHVCDQADCSAPEGAAARGKA
jgi:hypothetical protein